MNRTDEIRAHLSELAMLTIRTEAAEQRIRVAGEQRLVALQVAIERARARPAQRLTSKPRDLLAFHRCGARLAPENFPLAVSH